MADGVPAVRRDLSHKLPAKLADVYPGSAHVRHVGLLGAGDERVWDYALWNGLVIVSKYDDFQQRIAALALASVPSPPGRRKSRATTRRQSQVHSVSGEVLPA